MKRIKLIIFLLFAITIFSNHGVYADEDKILETYAKEDRAKVMALGFDIYSINTFSRASHAIEHINQVGRDKVLVDKTFDRKGNSYNIIVPGTGILTRDPATYNSYGTSRERAQSSIFGRNKDGGFGCGWGWRGWRGFPSSRSTGTGRCRR